MQQMCLFAQGDKSIFKKALYLAIIKDMLDWAQYLQKDEDTLSTLKQLAENYILDNCEFYVEKHKESDLYTNVNLPQQVFDWQILNGKDAWELTYQDLRPI